MEIKDKIKKELKSLEKVFERKPKYDLIELPWIDCAEDPVRPDLDLAFRQAYGRKIFGLRDEDKDIAAIICFAFSFLSWSFLFNSDLIFSTSLIFSLDAKRAFFFEIR